MKAMANSCRAVKSKSKQFCLGQDGRCFHGSQGYANHELFQPFYRFWIPPWMTDARGEAKQKQLWKELVAKMDEIQPGTTTITTS